MPSKSALSPNTIDVIGILALFTYALAAWLTHVIVCLQTTNWGFLIAGAILAPVGIVHGTGIWFGAW